MTKRGFVFEAPFSFLVDRLAEDNDFLDDARRILHLDEDAYTRLANQLANADTFLSRSELDAIVAAAIGEGSDRIASIIYRLAAIVHDADMPVIDAMEALGKAIQEKAEGLQPQERETLTERLRRLIAEPIGLAKQFKARQLVDVIGAELDDFRIICDIRPIFDQKRERIDGAIPLATFRLEYNMPDGDSAVVELRITEKQLHKLGDRVADASLKLRMIKELLASSNVAIPRTKSTMAEDES